MSPPAGMACDLMLVFALMLQGGLGSELERPLLVALALVPMTRIFSLALPIVPPGLAYRYAVTSVPVFLAAAAMARNLGMKRHDLGISLTRPALQLFTALISLPLAAVTYLILRPHALLGPAAGWPASLAVGLVLLISTGFVEEFTFRGVLQTASRSVLGDWGLPYASAVSASLYIGYQSATMVALMLAVGMGFGWIVARSGSLLGVSLAHGLANVGVFLVLPLVGLPPQ